MLAYEYEFGVFLGRMQPAHNAHLKNIKKALEVSEKVIVLIGSAQMGTTERNPFVHLERNIFLREVFQDEIDAGRMQIIPVDDEPLMKPPAWCAYLAGVIYSASGRPTRDYPNLIHPKTVMVMGEEQSNSEWYPEEELSKYNITALRMDRSEINISATELREAIVKGNIEKFHEFTHPEMHKFYWFMRNRLIALQNNKNKE